MKANASGATGAAQAGSSFLGTLLGNGGSTARYPERGPRSSVG